MIGQERQITEGDRYRYRGETYVVTRVVTFPRPGRVSLSHVSAPDRTMQRKPSTLDYSTEWEPIEA